MRIKRIIPLYLFVVFTVTSLSHTVSYPYSLSNNSITQYIIDLSKDIYASIQLPDDTVLYDSHGEVKLKVLLSPWGELKDVYISESSGNKNLDNICLNAVWRYERYQPFPEDLGDKDLWIDVPIIFELMVQDSKKHEKIKDDWKLIDKDKKGINVEILGIEEAIDIALENHIASRISQKEIELSMLKIREARRALYPAASLNYLETTGSVTTDIQDFTDKEYKLKFEYPLYYGRRLKYAVEQAMANMKASRYNHNKVLQELRVEVETSFYSHLATKVNVDLQELLLSEANGIFDMAKKRFDISLSTKAEFLQVESQYKQIIYQLASSKNDLEMARLSLVQAMNIENPQELDDLLVIDIDFMELGPVYIDVTLDQCIDLAFKSRPDLKVKESMVEFNEYERKIAQSKNQLKVDLTGSYGKSGGAFESESMTLEKDWFFGLKVSKPLGGNTLSTSYTKEETSIKHGVTSKTESITKSVEFNILDGLRGFSDRKSASIALDKARQELDETKATILKEVKETYLGYKKGLLQISSSLNKIKYREEELNITKARVELNEIAYSELLQAHINLNDEKSFYIESIGSLYQSLAKLNKTTGYTLFLDSENFMLADTGK